MIVAKTPASAKKAQSYAERLRVGIAVIHGEAQVYEGDQDQEDGRNSPPPQDMSENGHPLNVKPQGGENSWSTLPGKLLSHFA